MHSKEFLRSESSEARVAFKLTVLYLAASLLVAAGIIAIDKLVFPLNPTWLVFVWVFGLNPLLMLPFLARFLKARGGLRAVSGLLP